MKKTSYLYKNSLSITFFSLLVIFLIFQFFTGLKVKNEEQRDNGYPELTAAEYITSGHFIQSTFENWESEFLQMALYVVLTVFLRQQGSSESKKIGEKEEVDREPEAHPNAPWPVKKGGIWLKLYQYSLSIAFALLFLASYILHFYGSMKDYNLEQLEKGKPAETVPEFFVNPKFWFESFQNWQSEFLAVGAILVLSIWLRHKGSPESKPVDAPHFETGGS